jgi:hypothetical protein
MDLGHLCLGDPVTIGYVVLYWLLAGTGVFVAVSVTACLYRRRWVPIWRDDGGDLILRETFIFFVLMWPVAAVAVILALIEAYYFRRFNRARLSDRIRNRDGGEKH